MNIATIILVFVIVWWLVFFTMLPIGVKSQHESSDDMVVGTDPGAPVRPNLGRKALWTTLITSGLVAIYYIVATSGLVSLDPT